MPKLISKPAMPGKTPGTKLDNTLAFSGFFWANLHSSGAHSDKVVSEQVEESSPVGSSYYGQMVRLGQRHRVASPFLHLRQNYGKNHLKDCRIICYPVRKFQAGYFFADVEIA